MIDELAHRRIDNVERNLENHFKHIEKLEEAIITNTNSLAENTKLTKEIATNTAEMVRLYLSAKLFRTFILWTAPLTAAIAFLWKWFTDTSVITLINNMWTWFIGGF